MSKEKVAASSEFYGNKMLSIDKKQVEFCHRSIQPFFQGKTALEIGPAIGIMTEMLRRDFEKLFIIDGSEKLLKTIPDYNNVVKVASMIEDYYPDMKFDTIIMSHVLEHIENPVLVLKNIREWLSDNGVFIVGVPNAKSIHRLVACKMGLLDSIYTLNERDIELGHYRVYDMKMLKEHVIEAGFKVIDEIGVFLKPLSYQQIEDDWSDDMIEGFYEVGKSMPDHCAEIFLFCKAK
ncbi:MAG TPA: class I SAM-dependent methyltransferase [Ignavibacteriaceae bacterium]